MHPLQKGGGGALSGDAPGEGGDHHPQGVGQHLEAAVCGATSGFTSAGEPIHFPITVASQIINSKNNI